MRIVDPNGLRPYALVTPKDEDLQDAVAHANRMRDRLGQPALTPEQVTNLANRMMVSNADRAWLLANTPVGSVFDHLGVAHMVVGIDRVELGEFSGKAWRATVHCPNGQGGIYQSQLSATDLRARIEPGYVVPRET